MKKIILTAAAVFAFGFANAQIKTNAGTFAKPTAGTYIFEATMTPNITGGGIFSLPTLNNDLGLLGVKVRKFSSDKSALRLAANLAVKSSGEQLGNGDKAATEFAVGFSAGVENHMAGAERLSTYWGYEGNVGYVTKNDANNPIQDNQTKKLGLGANLFTGFDYYIMPKIYLGAEISYGLAVTNSKVGQADGVTKFELAPSITPTFRLGWQF
jgi:hypothetical protein